LIRPLLSRVDKQHLTGDGAAPTSPSVLDVIRQGIAAVKYLGGVAAAGLLYFDRAYQFVPVSVQSRKWGVIAAILAIVAGLGAHQSARRRQDPSVGWGFFWCAVIDLLLLIGLVSVPLPPALHAAASVAPILYALLFILLGGALGGFLM
jgi:hypothetical protein